MKKITKKNILIIISMLVISAVISLCIFNFRGASKWRAFIDKASTDGVYIFVHNGGSMLFASDDEIAEFDAVKKGEISKATVISDRDKMKVVVNDILKETRKLFTISKNKINNDGFVVIGFYLENGDALLIYENNTAIIVDKQDAYAYRVIGFDKVVEMYDKAVEGFGEDPYFQVK